MPQEDYQPSLRDYIAIVRRHLLLIVATFVSVSALAIVVALLVPPVYQSTGTIMIESQQIPTDLVQATVTSFADERIQVIKQRVMTRENLMRIIDKYQLFKDRSITFTPSEQIDEMRDRIGVTLVNANLQAGSRGSATIAFKVSFEDRRPDIAQRVANELVTLFLNENVKVRTERATQTTEFLTQEANKLKAELTTIESQIASYKQENGAALPQNSLLSMNAIQRLETDLRTSQRDYSAAEEEARSLDVELASAKAAVASAAAAVSGGVSAPGGANADELELQKLRVQLAQMQELYTDSYPDIRIAKRRIAALEKSIAEAAKQAAAAPADGDPATKALPMAPSVAAAQMVVAKIESRISSARSRMTALRAEQGQLQARLRDAESQMLKAPQVERGLASLMRDHETAQRKYEEIRAKQMSAQVAENLEGEQKAERFSLLEPPIAPDRPIKPNRRKMIALGLALAAMASVGMVVLLETLRGTVRGAGALTAIVGQRPLVIVPYITIAQEGVRKRKLMVRAAGAALVALVAALVAIHFLYMPLDTLALKVLLRLS
ncbi:GumC family protein [Comamonas flocculans]|uniref:Lipopolysaccharide biosynthesis protein n=1 Tax=Comamonas flocculans TaxID=2597701 RepID=A0A5B8RSH9_9BURK|nr:Wzz/FepE/Etk N-terminal domain-containing protein [Comamonas flocculans]QEA12496.1 lipopolysaccharide biosynthesis protein [Comamonas flocculans]